MTEEQQQDYKDNYLKVTIKDLAAKYCMSLCRMHDQINRLNLPRRCNKANTREGKAKKAVFSEFFCWENASIEDGIFGLQKGH